MYMWGNADISLDFYSCCLIVPQVRVHDSGSVTPMPNPVFSVTMLHACQAYRRTYSSVPHCEAVLLERQPFAFVERVGCSVTIVVIGRHDAVWKDSTATVSSRWWSWL